MRYLRLLIVRGIGSPTPAARPIVSLRERRRAGAARNFPEEADPREPGRAGDRGTDRGLFAGAAGVRPDPCRQ